jgi:hypothetical protein
MALKNRVAALCAWAVVCCAGAPWAMGQALPPVPKPLRICAWNVTNYSSTIPSSRDSAFQTSFYGVVPTGLALAGQSMYPDVVMGTEFMDAASVTNFRNILNSAPGSPGDWVAAPFRSGPDTQAAMFFRSSKVVLLDSTGAPVSNANLANPAAPTGNATLSATIIAVGTSSTCNQPRNTIRYDIAPVGYGAVGSRIGLYPMHLKAQGSNTACPGGENAQGRRLIEVQRMRANAAGINTNGTGTALPSGYHYIFGGDTNIQTSSAVDYGEFTNATGSGWQNGSLVLQAGGYTGGRVIDPIKSPGAWNNNGAFRYIHTQDPASPNGQMDDRHDQILISPGLADGVGMEYIGNVNSTYSTTTWNDPNHSYRCWGNDGSSYNLPLTTTGNTMVGQTIAQALVTTASNGGHLPVIIDMKVPPKVGVNTVVIDFGTVNVGASVTQTLVVSNAGEVARWTAAGISDLSYTLATSAPFGAPAGTFTRAAGAPGNSHTITLNTAAAGTFVQNLTISAPAATESPTLTVQLKANVINPAPTCLVDYNQDTFLNLDDLSDFITDYYVVPAIPGGAQANAPTYPGQNIGYGVACPGAPDAPPPYSINAYRTNGYRVGFSPDNSNNCPPTGPNLDNLGDYITAYYLGC